MTRLLALAAVAALCAACTAAPVTTPAATSQPPTVAPSATQATPGTPGPAVSYTWPPTSACGRERWPVKTGTDADAAHIDLGTVNPTTIQHLASLAPPAALPQDSRIPPVEVTVYQVQATLTGFKQEPDSDYHLILSDGTRTMIAEIPDPACVGKGSPLLPGIELARTQFDARYHPSTDHFTHVSVPVTVTGVGFWDFDHGQDGVAPNAIELHPVRNIRFGTAP